MDGVHAMLERHAEDRLHVQVGVDRASIGRDQVRLIRLIAVEGQRVFLAVDRDGPLSELGAGAEDPDRDLAAIRSENPLEVSEL